MKNEPTSAKKRSREESVGRGGGQGGQGGRGGRGSRGGAATGTGTEPDKKARVTTTQHVPSLEGGGFVSSDFVRDQFHLDKPLDLDTDVCAMCKQGHDFAVVLQRVLPSVSDLGKAHIDGSLREDSDDENDENNTNNTNNNSSNSGSNCAPIDPECVWVSRYSVQSHRRAFVHFYCALYSPRTWFTGKEWHNVAREVSRSAALTCTHCKKRGASIGCCYARCNVVLHFPCAIKNGFEIYRYSQGFHCAEHAKFKDFSASSDNNNNKNNNNNMDLSLGKEPIPVLLKDDSVKLVQEFRGDSQNKLSAFTYVTNNVDSDEVVSNSRNVDGLQCCSCADLCDDVETCECLRAGRNYTYQGLLVNRGQGRILECNLKCHCSYRRCTNRVVEKGLTYRLQVFRLTGKENSGPTRKYGVRTLDFIPQFAFVCQVNGQFVNIERGPNKATRPFEVDRNIYRITDWEDKRSTDEAEPLLFDDNICLDCRRFGNLAAFIRRARANAAAPPMLIRKLVYNSMNPKSFPKLALFAAVNIPANTELLL